MKLSEAQKLTKAELIAILEHKYPSGAYAHDWQAFTKKELVDFYFFPHPRRGRSPARSRSPRSPRSRSRSRSKSPRRK